MGQAISGSGHLSGHAAPCITGYSHDVQGLVWFDKAATEAAIMTPRSLAFPAILASYWMLELFPDRRL